MKIIIYLTALIIFSFSCKKTELKETLRIEDLLGTWVSLDSLGTYLPGGGFAYYKDTIHFFSEYQYNQYIKIKQALVTERAVYRFNMSPIDYIGLEFLFFNKSGVLPNRNDSTLIEVNFSEIKDTVTLNKLSETFPYTRFDKFYKLK